MKLLHPLSAENKTLISNTECMYVCVFIYIYIYICPDILSAMQAGTTAIFNVFGMTGPSNNHELNP